MVSYVAHGPFVCSPALLACLLTNTFTTLVTEPLGNSEVRAKRRTLSALFLAGFTFFFFSFHFFDLANVGQVLWKILAIFTGVTLTYKLISVLLPSLQYLVTISLIPFKTLRSVSAQCLFLSSPNHFEFLFTKSEINLFFL